MKTRTPFSHNDLKIKKKDRVLEIGPGHNPFFRANVLLEKFIESNFHRCGDVKVYPHQEFINGDAENLPFPDKSFDYIYCSNVLEHVEHPEAFFRELSRVGKRGYIETPSIMGESMFPKKSHKWCVLDIDGKLVLFEKAAMPGNYGNDYGEACLNYLPYQSLPYKIAQMTETQFSFVRYEWKDGIDYVINPEDEEYRRYFTQPWTREMCEKIYPPRGLWKEFCRTMRALRLIVCEKISSKLHRDRIPKELFSAD